MASPAPRTSPYRSAKARIRPSNGKQARWHAVKPSATWRAMCGATLAGAASSSTRDVFVHDELACRTCVAAIHRVAAGVAALDG